ncbi:Gas vesicle protein [Pilibacter termitis]|uniref:Gas vesicle protein n=1 Tax=Pilibacter termitis TaxID=263852 RepID=A0A1T4LE69_9ENTE|nr:YtxH domain-containing protein [Pilibacter termitis]SJZ52857.1 Gas vesicle protein [Pilibacter termitis]
MSMKNFGKGLIFGAVVAGVATLLTNRNKGEENRKFLTDFIDEVKNEVEQGVITTTTIRLQSEEVKKQVATALQPAMRDIQKSIKDFQFQAEPRITQIQEQIETIQEHLPKV